MDNNSDQIDERIIALQICLVQVEKRLKIVNEQIVETEKDIKAYKDRYL